MVQKTDFYEDRSAIEKLEYVKWHSINSESLVERGRVLIGVSFANIS